MSARGQNDPPKQANGKRAPRKRSEPAMEVRGTIVPDAAIRALVDECIVPALVEKFLKEKAFNQAEQDA